MGKADVTGFIHLFSFYHLCHFHEGRTGVHGGAGGGVGLGRIEGGAISPPPHTSLLWEAQLAAYMDSTP